VCIIFAERKAVDLRLKDSSKVQSSKSEDKSLRSRVHSPHR
jgi:hypothetical protein